MLVTHRTVSPTPIKSELPQKNQSNKMDHITGYESNDDDIVETVINNDVVVTAPVVIDEPVIVQPVVLDVPPPRTRNIRPRDETPQERQDRLEMVRYDKDRWFKNAWFTRGKGSLNNEYPIPAGFYNTRPQNKRSKK